MKVKMKNSLLSLLILTFPMGVATAQSPRDTLKQIQRIKLLEMSRYEVQQILYEYKVSDRNDHHQRFSNDDVEIDVFYSSGECLDDPAIDDSTEMWKVEEWKVTRIEIVPENALKVEDAGVSWKRFKKEQLNRESPTRHVYHDKASGISFDVTEDGIRGILIFPSRNNVKKLCGDGESDARAFYSRESWFSAKLEDRGGETYCPVPSVDNVELSAREIVGATSDKTVSVITTASDPENDILTYVYKVSAGRIKGSGARVVWDLTGLSAGTYTITAGVDDGCGLCGKTMTKTLVVK